MAKAEAAIATARARLGASGGWLDAIETETVLDAYGLARARSRTVTSAAAAETAAAALGGSVVLKVQSPSALHKSDVGGIVLDVAPEDAAAAYEQVTGAVADSTGALVQEFIPGGHEVIIGMTEDASFGPLIAFGLGGVFVELIGDVAFRIHPLTDVDAAEMVSEVRSARLLEGYRGGEEGDIPALRSALLRVSSMIEDLPDIVEMDLNPVKVLPPGHGLTVVDARIRIGVAA